MPLLSRINAILNHPLQCSGIAPQRFSLDLQSLGIAPQRVALDLLGSSSPFWPFPGLEQDKARDSPSCKPNFWSGESQDNAATGCCTEQTSLGTSQGFAETFAKFLL